MQGCNYQPGLTDSVFPELSLTTDNQTERQTARQGFTTGYINTFSYTSSHWVKKPFLLLCTFQMEQICEHLFKTTWRLPYMSGGCKELREKEHSERERIKICTSVEEERLSSLFLPL